MVLEAIKYDSSKGTLDILDQLQLPHKTIYRKINGPTDAYDAIKSMQVRGAPAIAIVAALSIAVKIYQSNPASEAFKSNAKDVRDDIWRDLDYLVTSRPTAVNLAGAASLLKKAVDEMVDEGQLGGAVATGYIRSAERMLEDDVRDNEAIGHWGSAWILKDSKSPVSVLTHCNTGSLATAGYGTALGVIRSLHSKGSLKRAFFTETRPYNQGSRLTAFELLHDDIQATLITDSMASALLHLKKDPENIAAIVVGADRVVANGDTANKIGTYSLAIAARYHQVKFLVAAPSTTIDLNTKTGEGIVIEERRGVEMTTIRGPSVTANGNLHLDDPHTVSIAAKDIGVWNPAFDVTPASLIDGIITEYGVVEKAASGLFDLQQFLQDKKSPQSGQDSRDQNI